MKPIVEVAIETALFGDYYVAAYIDKELILEHKYFVNSKAAASLVAQELRKKYEKEGHVTDYKIY